MKLSDFVKKTNQRDNLYRPRPRVVCNDGFSLSIQAGNSELACEPRRFAASYKSFEVGFPSEVDPLLLPYDSKRNYGIYEYVPFGVLEELIEKHGGINEQEVLERLQELEALRR